MWPGLAAMVGSVCTGQQSAQRALLVAVMAATQQTFPQEIGAPVLVAAVAVVTFPATVVLAATADSPGAAAAAAGLRWMVSDRVARAATAATA